MQRSVILICLLAAIVGCHHPVKEGPSLGEDPDLLGPNLTAEIRSGEFFIGPGDEVELSVWDHNDLSRSYTVGSDGTIHCHLVGKVEAEGLSREQLRDRLAEAYARYLVDPSVDIKVTLGLERKITVLGQVASPGVFPVSDPRTTVVEMVARAGGVGKDGDTSGVILAREVEGNVQVRHYSLDLLFDPPDYVTRTQIPFVQPGDYVYVLKTDRAKYAEYVDVIDRAMRAIVLGERAILLAPQVSEQINQ